ncbi:MAG: hypothetical protein JW969_14610 [Spirochaetales bacterium]|nr:hypothetical protein [Spirochaetales bacterium]
MSNLKNILEKMTLEEKAGQMLMENFVGRYEVPQETLENIQNGRFGSILYFSGCNVVDSFQLKDLTSKIQAAARKSRLSMPLLVAIDQEGGQLAPITKNISIHPGNMAIAAIPKNNEEYAYKMGEITGSELKTIGINANLAPVVDISHVNGTPIKDNRYFGDNPDKVAALGAAFIKGNQSQGVMACAKHFPGQRNVEVDSHDKLDVIPYDYDRLMKVELLPFKKAVDAGVEMIMTLHAAYTALDPANTPATLSTPIITGVLRKTLGYDNIVISDDLKMKPIMDVYGFEKALIMAVNAGVDLVVISFSSMPAYEIIVDAVKKGHISEDRLNESVMRILRAKKKYATFDVDNRKKTMRILARKESKKAIEEVANKSITLVKNEANVLPLKTKKTTRIAIIRPMYGRLVMSDNTNFFMHNFADSFRKYHENVAEYVTGLQPNSVERLGLSDWAYICDYTIFCTYNAYQFEEQMAALEEARKLTQDDRIILVALRSPNDLKIYPKEIPTVITTYGVTKASIDALARLCLGKIKAEGKLVVPVL